MVEKTYIPPIKRLTLDKYELSEKLNINLDELSFEDNILKKVNVYVIGHFGNCVSLNLECDFCHPIPFHNNTGNIGYLLSFLIEFFNKTNDNAQSIDVLNNTEVCLVFEENGNGKCVAIGNKQQTKFFIIKDFITLHE